MPWRPLKTLRGRRVDDKYDVQCSRHHWWPATVVEIAGGDADACIKVSYDGWAKKYDEWITDAAKVRKPRGSEELVLETAAATGTFGRGTCDPRWVGFVTGQIHDAGTRLEVISSLSDHICSGCTWPSL